MEKAADPQEQLSSLITQYGFQNKDITFYMKQLQQIQSQPIQSITFNAPNTDIIKLEQLNERHKDITLNLTKALTLLNETRESIIAILKNRKGVTILEPIPEVAVKRTISVPTSTTPLITEEEANRIMRGSKKQSKQTGYSSQIWSIGYDEIVQTDAEAIDSNNPDIYEMYRMRCRGMHVCVKIFDKQFIKQRLGTIDRYKMFHDEGESIVATESPFVCKTVGVCVEESNVIFVREWMHNGSLDEHLLSKSTQYPPFKFGFWMKITIAESIAEAMRYVIEHDFTNPNLNLSNILFDENWNVKLADQTWRDFYVMCELVNKVVPAPQDLVNDFGSLLVNLITNSKIHPLPTDQSGFMIPTKLRTLIQECMEPNPKHRPNFDQLSDTNLYDKIFKESCAICEDKIECMWRDLSNNRLNVSWEEFVPAFCESFILPFYDKVYETFEFNCFASLLGIQNTETLYVTHDALIRFIRCIGPFIEGTEILDKAKMFIEMPWFFGAINTQEAENLIAPLENNSFLVRYSSNIGDLTMTFKHKEKILHTRIPETAKYNVQEYIALVQIKKKFIGSPPSPFLDLIEQNNTYYLPWKFIN